MLLHRFRDQSLAVRTAVREIWCKGNEKVSSMMCFVFFLNGNVNLNIAKLLPCICFV